MDIHVHVGATTIGEYYGYARAPAWDHIPSACYATRFAAPPAPECNGIFLWPRTPHGGGGAVDGFGDHTLVWSHDRGPF